MVWDYKKGEPIFSLNMAEGQSKTNEQVKVDWVKKRPGNISVIQNETLQIKSIFGEGKNFESDS